MKEIQIDDLDVGDEVALHLPGDELGLRGTYTGIIYDALTRLCELEIVTPFGFPVQIPTSWKPMIFRTKRAPKPKSEAGKESR